MQIHIFPDYDTLSDHTAGLILEVVRQKPDSLICIASGDTPKGVCDRLVAAAHNGAADFSACTFIGLDEWVGMDENDPGSCSWLLYEYLYRPLSLRPDQIICLDAKSADMTADCARVNAIVAARGGLDIMLLGIGLNGHLGLNEPGSSFDDYAHVSTLAPITIEVAQKYFNRAVTLEKGITLGIRHFREARLPILMASGPKKAAIIERACHGPVDTGTPASVVQTLAHAVVLVDEAAGSGLR